MSTMTSAEKEWLRKLRANKSAKSEEDIAHTQSIEAKPEPHKSEVIKHGFNDVAGMDELKKFVKEGFIDVLNNRECAKAFGIVPPSMLFYGPAGCGKSFFAEKIADELKEVGVHFVKIVPDDLASTLVHGTQEKIGEVFRKAEQKAPTLIFFDEFDSMVPKRSNDDRNYQNGETNEFLCMLNNAADRGVYVLAATNHPERIDKAVLRTGRIDELIYVEMPDSKARESLFRLSLSKLPAADDIDYAILAELTHGYNCSDISYIIKVASRQSFVASIQEKDQPYKRITQSMLEESIAHRSPSVTSQDLREYERVRAEFSPKDEKCQQQRIGFC
ncbi:MAG: ATP-binding protein [Paludibacteraceae bacterium]|nr:ATP-binding protein [Paludibacteraceae bacterium]